MPTKSILVGQTFQQQLQHLNYEVSYTNCYEETTEHKLAFFNYFDAIILNETLSQDDCLGLLGSLPSLEKPIYRRSQSTCNRRKAEIWQERGIIRWLDLKNSLEDIREEIDMVDQSFAEVAAELLDDQAKKIRFIKNERRFLKILYQHTYGGLDRDQIYHLLWQKEPDASTKSQLPFVCKRMKQRFSDAGMNEKTITTPQGKEYQINKQILPYLEQTLLETAQQGKVPTKTIDFLADLPYTFDCKLKDMRNPILITESRSLLRGRYQMSLLAPFRRT